MWASLASQLVVPLLLLAQASSMMDYVPVISGAPPPVETHPLWDRADMFGSAASKQAQDELSRIRREYLVPVRIETVMSLDGAWIADVAGQRRAQSVGPEQLYILMASEEKDVGVVAARRGPASRLTDQQREQIRQAFLGPLQAGDADGALERGIRALGATLESSAASTRTSIGWDILFPVTVVLVGLAILAVSRGLGMGRRQSKAAQARRNGLSPANNDRTGWGRTFELGSHRAGR